MQAHDALEVAGFGVLAGMRSLSAPALLSREFSREPTRFFRRSLRGFASQQVGRVLTTLAIGELAADKAPFTPPRIAPPVLAGRILSGAFTGAALAKRRGRPVLVPVLLGAAAAVASSYAFYSLRRLATQRLRVPNVLAGFLEDGLALLLSNRLASALE